MKTRVFVYYSGIQFLICISSILFFFYSCQRPNIEEESSARFIRPTLTKVDLEDSENVDYGQIPSLSFFPDSIYPPITLDNGLVVKELDDSTCLTDFDILIRKNRLDDYSKISTTQIENPRSATIITTYPSTYYWSDGVVPYKFNMSMPPAYRSLTVQAMQEISSSSPIRFVFIGNSTTYQDYLVFNYSNVNNSYVGRQGGPQTININSFNKGVIMHEIMHALGFHHEHSRIDRDTYIYIDTLNVRPNMRQHFRKYNHIYPNIGLDLGYFDYNSIMMYSLKIKDTSFVYNPNVNTIYSLLGDSTFAGQRDSLSTGDINGLLTIYDIPPHNITTSTTVINEHSDWSSYYYEAYETISLSFYEDDTYDVPKVLNRPVRLNVVRTHITCNSITHELNYDTEVITKLCIPGQSSFVLETHTNIVYEIYGNPYEFDVVYYTLQ